MKLLFISWGQIRTVDLSGMSRTLSPTELPSHVSFSLKSYSHTNILKNQP